MHKRAVMNGVLGGLAASTVLAAVVNPWAQAATGVAFAPGILYPYILSQITGIQVGAGAGNTLHWIVFCAIIPALWAWLGTAGGTSRRLLLAVVVPSAAWLLLMGILVPLAGLPVFYGISLTTIWSAAAFFILSLGLVGSSFLTKQ